MVGLWLAGGAGLAKVLVVAMGFVYPSLLCLSASVVSLCARLSVVGVRARLLS